MVDIVYLIFTNFDLNLRYHLCPVIIINLLTCNSIPLNILLSVDISISFQKLIDLGIKAKLLRFIDLLITDPDLHYFSDHHFKLTNFSVIKFAKKIHHFYHIELFELQSSPMIPTERTHQNFIV